MLQSHIRVFSFLHRLRINNEYSLMQTLCSTLCYRPHAPLALVLKEGQAPGGLFVNE